MRPGFTDLVADVKARKIGAVLPFAPDRISRNVSEYGLFKATLKNMHCCLVYVNGGEQALDDPYADLISTMLSGVSQWESAIKSTRVAAAYAQKRARGDFPTTPNRLFGYTHDGELHSTEAPLMCDAATRILAGESLCRIAREWEDSGVTTTGGGRPTAQNVRTALLIQLPAGLFGLRPHQVNVSESIEFASIPSSSESTEAAAAGGAHPMTLWPWPSHTRETICMDVVLPVPAGPTPQAATTPDNIRCRASSTWLALSAKPLSSSNAATALSIVADSATTGTGSTIVLRTLSSWARISGVVYLR